MSAAFVPTFTRELTARAKEHAFRLGSQTLNALLIVTGIIVVLGIVFAWPLSTFYAGSFEEVPGKLALTASLTRIMFPFLTLVAVAVAMMGMLNALGRFFLPALSPAMFNVAIIFSALVISPLAARFADLRRRHRDAGRRRADRAAMAGASCRRVSSPVAAGSARPALRESLC